MTWGWIWPQQYWDGDSLWAGTLLFEKALDTPQSTFPNTSFTWRCILHSVIYMQRSILSSKVKDCSCSSPLYKSREPCHWGTQEGSLYQWCYFESSVTFLLWLHCLMHYPKFQSLWFNVAFIILTKGPLLWMALSLQKTIYWLLHIFLNPERQILSPCTKKKWGLEKMAGYFLGNILS